MSTAKDPPKERRGGTLTRFGPLREPPEDQKRGVRKMDRKVDPQKIDFWRILSRVRADPGGVCGPHLALEFEESHFWSSTPCPPRGRRIEDALRQATAAPVILARISLWGLGGLCVACPCGRFVFRQGLGRPWQILADLGQNNLLDMFWVPWGPCA